MDKKHLFVFVLGAILLALVATGCQKVGQPQTNQPVGLANPAAIFCEEQGGKVTMREEAGGTAGYCVFPDGSECEEWAYFRNECQPGTDWQENPLLTALKSGELLQCIVGRNADGQNLFKIVRAEDDCPGANNEQALAEFCGKDTVRAEYCEGLVKLTSNITEAGPMFFDQGKILTCPVPGSPDMTADCQAALDMPCSIMVECQ